MKKILLLSLMLGVAPAAFAEYRMTPREAIYYWASEGNLKNLRALQKSGYSLDMPDARGQQAVCEAVYKNDVKAFKTLQKAGANMNVYCLYGMPNERRYEFNQFYYGLPLVVPVMTEDVLTEETELVQSPLLSQIDSQPDIQSQSSPVYFVEGAYEEDMDVFEREPETVYNPSDFSDSIAFKPYVAANLFYGKSKSKLEASFTEKRSYRASDDVPGLALAFGTKISDFRAELAVQGNLKATDRIIDGLVKTKVQSYAGFLNGYYNIPTGIALTPYIGAGIGLARNSATLSDDFVKYHNTKWSFAWQLAAGLNYALTDSLVADLGYRYTDYGKVNIVNENGVKYRMNDIRTHNVTLGLRYEM